MKNRCKYCGYRITEDQTICDFCQADGYLIDESVCDLCKAVAAVDRTVEGWSSSRCNCGHIIPEDQTMCERCKKDIAIYDAISILEDKPPVSTEIDLPVTPRLKVCCTCKQAKELTEFHKDKGTLDGRKYVCKECVKIKRKEYYLIHSEREAAYKKDNYKTSGRNRQYIRKYNITLQEYDDILEAQGGHCAICSAVHNQDGTRLCVDHDHTTGKIRGILCTSCNALLGYANDDIDTLTKAIEYLNGSKS